MNHAIRGNDAATPHRPRIAIIGAGCGGLGVALKLRAAGYRDFLIFDDRAAVGGTWCANGYPGAACDAPSHVYRFSFTRPAEWSRRFAPGPEIRAYLARCASDGGLEAHLRLNTRVTAARWTGVDWLVEFADGGPERFDVVVAATGQLNVPARPNVPGPDSFAGPVVHTAEWPEDLDLTGRRVAVIGTGASAAQVIPEIAKSAAHLTVFQRSAAYVFPKADTAYSPRLHRLYRTVPVLSRLARAFMMLLLETSNIGFWKFPQSMWLLERWHTARLKRVVADPDVRAALTPDYRAGCKRILMSSEYHPTFTAPHVTLETAPITGVDENGIGTATRHYDLDAIVLATGFDTSVFAPTLTVTGAGERDLHALWQDGPRAHFGISVPEFPNFFLVYGPDTNLGSGSITVMLETQATHIVDAVELLAAAPPHTAAEVDRQALARSQHWLHRQLDRPSVWNSGCHSWYQDALGRDTHNWPTSVLGYRLRAGRLRRADYRLTTRAPHLPLTAGADES